MQMKLSLIKFLPLPILFLLLSCTSIKVVKKPYKTVSFTSKEDIVAGMNEAVEFSREESSEDMDEDYKKRLDSLIPDKIFTSGMDELIPDTSEQSGETEIPASTDLTDYVTRVKDQNNGYCTAFATAGALEATLCKQSRLCTEDLSEQYLFSLYNKYSTRRAVEAAEKNWLADEKYWPKYGSKARDIAKFVHARFSKVKYLGSDHDALMAAIAKGHFVVIAMRTPKDMLSCRNTIRTSTRFSSGGHAIMAVGYQKTDQVTGGMYVKIKNSWGDDCGEYGFQYVPFKAICKKTNAYCYYWEIEEAVSTKSTLCSDS